MAHYPKRVVPEPNLVRRIRGSFAWLDHRLLREGHLLRLTLEELGVYVFLALAADRDGVSWYRKEKISDALGLDWDQFERARTGLLDKGFIAFRPYQPGAVNGHYQILPLPEPRHA